MKKYIIIGIVIIILFAGMFWAGWFANDYFSRPDPGHQHEDRQVSGDKITTSNYRFYDTFGMFDIVAEGKGEATTKFQRPDRWKNYKDEFILNAIIGVNHKRTHYGAEIMYYRMIFPCFGIGGGVGFMCTNEELHKIDYEALFKIGFTIKCNL